jgi:hypothetical protein
MHLLEVGKVYAYVIFETTENESGSVLAVSLVTIE